MLINNNIPPPVLRCNVVSCHSDTRAFRLRCPTNTTTNNQIKYTTCNKPVIDSPLLSQTSHTPTWSVRHDHTTFSKMSWLTTTKACINQCPYSYWSGCCGWLQVMYGWIHLDSSLIYFSCGKQLRVKNIRITAVHSNNESGIAYIYLTTLFEDNPEWRYYVFSFYLFRSQLNPLISMTKYCNTMNNLHEFVSHTGGLLK